MGARTQEQALGIATFAGAPPPGVLIFWAAVAALLLWLVLIGD